MNSDRVHAVRTIDASAARIFALLADPHSHPSLAGAEDVVEVVDVTDVPLRLGSEFQMRMRRGGVPYTTTSVVVAYVENQTIAWRTTMLGGLLGGRVWRYDLEVVPAGTIVTETWDVSEDRQRWLLRRGSLAETTQRQMTRSLDRLAGLLARD
ncbi:SRPBCC family protein [Mumia sp. zg.B21]|uniref:SRPBCC family protein n=1 Tax=Mumia sp. zg.B21 TaxID=2855447 RepID=UPI001C6DDCC5|nr:SRPBCC family protein [Mumia sp. zg.B21]MBW9210363.1 SRPBCC family protein [Mumia sp. zg.B21]